MLGRTYDTQNCSAARALELVGERWSLLIIRDALFAGHARFGDFQRSLGVASNILTARLDSFVAAGLMERRRYSEHPEHYEYLLTGKGRDLAPVIVALTAWATGTPHPTARRSSTSTPPVAAKSISRSAAPPAKYQSAMPTSGYGPARAYSPESPPDDPAVGHR